MAMLDSTVSASRRSVVLARGSIDGESVEYGRHRAITSETVAFFNTPLPDIGARAEAWGIHNWCPRR